MNAVKFLKEKNRMCASFGNGCDGCPLSMASIFDLCSHYINLFPDKAADIVEKWARENPIQTKGASNMNARILFRPICSNCHKEIREPIDYYVDDDGSGKAIVNGFTHMVNNFFVVKPCKCPHCDCYFDGIEIPGLPFDNTARY